MRAKDFIIEGEVPSVFAIYDNFEKEYHEDGTVTIHQEPDGSYYGTSNHFDFRESDLPSLIKSLKKWGYTQHVYGEDILNNENRGVRK